MASLRETPDFKTFQEALASRYESLARRLLTCESYEDYRETRGAIGAYEDVFRLCDLVVTKAEELDEYRRESAVRDRAAADYARANAYGTRYWDTQ